MLAVIAYLLYIIISICIVIVVARTLKTYGRALLVNHLGANRTLADSLSHMLVVGFYLINFGGAALILKAGDQLQESQQVIEYLSAKIGVVLLMLSLTHFFSLYLISRPREWTPSEEYDEA